MDFLFELSNTLTVLEERKEFLDQGKMIIAFVEENATLDPEFLEWILSYSEKALAIEKLINKAEDEKINKIVSDIEMSNNKALMKITGGTITGVTQAIRIGRKENTFTTNVEITDGTVTAEGTAIYMPGLGTLKISGGTISATKYEAGICAVSGSIEITGGTISGGEDYGKEIVGSTNTPKEEGFANSAIAVQKINGYRDFTSLKVESATLTAGSGAPAQITFQNFASKDQSKVTANNYSVAWGSLSDEGVWTTDVSSASDLVTAVNAAESNATTERSYAIDVNENLTIGSGEGQANITEIPANTTVVIAKNKGLTVAGTLENKGTINADGSNGTNGSLVCTGTLNNSGNITVKNGITVGVRVNENGTVNMTGGKISGGRYTVIVADGTFNMTGGELENDGTADGNLQYACIQLQDNSAKATITGGTITQEGTRIDDIAITNLGGELVVGEESGNNENIKITSEGTGILLTNDAGNFNGYTLTVNSGTIEGKNFAIGNNGKIDTSNISSKKAEINIKGGVIKGTGTPVTDNNSWDAVGTGIYHPGYGTLNIYGGTISGTSSGVEVRNGILNVTGGNISSTYEGEATTAKSNTAPTSGQTTVGAGIAIAPYKKDVRITATLSAGTITGKSAVYVSNPDSATKVTWSDSGTEISGYMCKIVNKIENLTISTPNDSSDLYETENLGSGS